MSDTITDATPKPKRQRRPTTTITLAEAFGTHCRLMAGLMRSGVPLPPEVLQTHAGYLDRIAAWLEPQEEEAGPALPLIGGA